MSVSNARSNSVRMDIAKVRRRMRSGSLRASDVFCNPPQELGAYPVFQVILWCRGHGTHKLRQINRAAITEGIDLSVPLGEASIRTCAFVAAHVRRNQYEKGAPSRRPAPKATQTPEQAQRQRIETRSATRVANGTHVHNDVFRRAWQAMDSEQRPSWAELSRRTGREPDYLRSAFGFGARAYRTMPLAVAQQLLDVFHIDPHEAGL